MDVAEADEPEVAPETAIETSRAADGGYESAASQEAPSTSRRGRPAAVPALRAEAAELFTQINNDPAASQRLALVQNLLTQRLVQKGSLPTQVALADMEELVKVLQAVAGDAPMAPPPLPQLPASEPAPTSGVDADPTVVAAKAALVDAEGKLVVAKGRLVSATAAVEKAMTAKNFSEVGRLSNQELLPAEENVKAVEVLISTAAASLADARAAVLEQINHTRKVQQAEAEKGRVAVANAQRSQAQAIQQAPQPAQGGAGLPFPLLVYGGFTGRGVAHVHLNDIIGPYRVRVEQQHHVAYYGMIKGDGSARVVEALLADLQAGTFQLPNVVLAPAYTEGLEKQVVRALEDYFASVIYSAR